MNVFVYPINLDDDFRVIAEQQSKRLVEAHERFSVLMDRQKFQVVYPVLPMDLLGIFILLPEYCLGPAVLNYSYHVRG